ncbi:MAG: DUF262 domain-containing protein [Oscillatoria sp. PMC 1068.18]|nr:DUF262 domain-containing protein [Oscillatoria sp. PMC 1068.18]
MLIAPIPATDREMNLISTFDITKYPLLDILRDVSLGKIQLPDFQRDWIWNDQQIRKVLASVSLGYPIGAVMMLQQADQLQFKPRPIDCVYTHQLQSPKFLILDGQQRLTTLYKVLASGQPTAIRDPKKRHLSERWYYLDLQKCIDPHCPRINAILSLPESKRIRPFQGCSNGINCSTPEAEYEHLLFPLSQLTNFSTWRSKYSRYWEYDADKLKLLDTLELEVLKKFEHYQIPVIQLRDFLPKEAVCEVFENSNTSGCDLNFFDLMSSSYCAENFSLRDDWKDREAQLQTLKVLRLLRHTDFLQAIALVSTYSHRLEALQNGNCKDKLPAIGCNRNDVLALSKEDYQQWADPVTKGFQKAARFLHGLKIFDAKDLAYPSQLVALSAMCTIIDDNCFNSEQTRSKLVQWFWSGLFGEVYTGWHETKTARDFVEIPKWLVGGPKPQTVVNATLTPERLQRVRKRYGAVYQGFAALLRSQGAVDFITGEAINDVLYFEEQIDSHHIFPAAWCRKQGIDSKRYNSLINRTPLSARTNKKIGSKPPSAYLRQFEEAGTPREKIEMILRSHAIDPDALRRDDFELFYQKRLVALLQLIGKAMGKSLLPEAYYLEMNGNDNGHHIHPEMIDYYLDRLDLWGDRDA